MDDIWHGLSFFVNSGCIAGASSQLSEKNVKTDKKKIETLIADISHQTKTPISNLLLYEELLEEQELNEISKEYVNQMHTQTEKLSFLITSLVKLSRLEAGILVLHPVTQEISPMVKKVTEGYQALDRGGFGKSDRKCHQIYSFREDHRAYKTLSNVYLH